MKTCIRPVSIQRKQLSIKACNANDGHTKPSMYDHKRLNEVRKINADRLANIQNLVSDVKNAIQKEYELRSSMFSKICEIAKDDMIGIKDKKKRKMSENAEQDKADKEI